ncbi:MAG: DUF1573 domain-containing protein [Bacteroidota bacterium]|jgi:hypothetical protein|nr:DUF1573 domain-containing protein [Flavisolibacter sp.]MDQ3551802.1 DUF1573 domain-containing protein [Bacteroidota bacterium]
MRLSLLGLFLFITIYGLQAQDQHNHANHDLKFIQTEYNFGKIPQGKPVYHFFEVINNGTEPIVISNVSATCGCTTPEWTKEPIAPGSSAKIKVGYNSASEGYFEKNITVQYNDNHTKQLIIKGDVWKTPVGAAPSNASVQFLKKQIN